jgi:choline dehydrogenase-like flavoprotein
MIEDLRRSAQQDRSTDICIVGAGAAGIALAMEFAGTSRRVLMVESGGDRFDAEADALSAGDSIGVPFIGLRSGRYRGLGGATRLWAGQCLPFDTIDFEQRPWVPESTWPIGLGDLKDFYVRAEKFFGLTGREVYDERIWPRFHLTDPGFDHSILRPRFTVYSPFPDLIRVYRRPLQAAPNVSVALYGHALKFHLAQGGSRVESLEVGIPGGSRFLVRASTFVLCNGGIEAARLLLLSSDERSAGIGNERDLVGRYYQDHPNGIVASVNANAPRALQDHFTILYRERKRYFPKIRLAPEVQKREHTLNAVAHLVFEYEEAAVDALRAFVRAARRRALPRHALRKAGAIAMGSGETLTMLYRRYVRGRSPNFTPRRILLQAHVEQAPNRDSRILLSDTVDTFGQPRVRMDWRLGNLEHHTFAAITDRVGSEFARLGLGTLQAHTWTRDATSDWTTHVEDAYHHIGATRMSSEPSSGVVTPELRVHSTANLYVCSSSVFPTSGYANPTLTIVALALRLADFLKQRPA